MSEKFDVIIIGGGMSGIAAGIRLSYYDKKVLILEKHSIPGGLNSYYYRKGRYFDVGLHAITNSINGKNKKAPLSKLLRQLKLKREDFNLSPQISSKIKFNSKELSFTNDISFLEAEIEKKFPEEIEGFLKLKNIILNHDELSLKSEYSSSRDVLASSIGNKLLIDMLLCPLMYYGSAYEYDMDFSQFVIMFKSIFLEGFSRPKSGVKFIIDNLFEKYRTQNGMVKFKAGVREIIVEDKIARGVILDSGEKILGNKIFSSAGICETQNMISGKALSDNFRSGQLSFVEFIFVLDILPSKLGFNDTIIFFNETDKFNYRKPDKIIDDCSGVLCCPNNFQYDTPMNEGIIRLTHMANFDKWNELSDEDYKKEKELWIKNSMEKLSKYIPEFKKHILFTDMFTPLTVKKYTGHLNGAVYGSPDKIRDGNSGIKNLHIIGTDQGFLGIIGSMLSGISMANLHGLMEG